MNVATIKTLFTRFKTKHKEHDRAEKQCGNCNTQIIGNYCHACGQSAHVHHSLMHLIEEMIHGLWHFDAKGWRTIPLLIAYPGELTRRYIDGQRVRFISPLGLFLFMVFFMFFVFSFSKTETYHFDSPQVKAAEIGDLEKEIAAAKVKVAQEQAKFDQAKKTGKEVEDRQDALSSALEDVKDLETTLARINKGDDIVSANFNSDLKIDDSEQNIKSATGMKAAIIQAYKHYKENKDLFFYKLKNNAYKFALILIPLSMPIVWLMFIGKKNVTMFDHAVFSLYSLSFMAFFAAILSILFQYELGGTAMLLLLMVPPVHMYRQLKGTYQLSIFSTVWRTFFLSTSACMMLLVFMLFVTTLSAR